MRRDLRRLLADLGSSQGEIIDAGDVDDIDRILGPYDDEMDEEPTKEEPMAGPETGGSQLPRGASASKVASRWLAAGVKKRILFYECEHSGDADNYIDDIVRCGGKIHRTRINEDEESCVIEVEVADWADFKKKFSRTESFGFSSLG